MKILLAEDTKDLNHVLSAALRHQGYEVDSVFDGQEAFDAVTKNGYDLLILDIMMPKRDGLSVLKEVRRLSNVTPVIMLTAKTEVDDRVAGLDAGADDYLTKPFAMKELLARVRAMTRRRTEYSAVEMHFEDLVLRGSTFELECENAVRLSVKEFELMQTFILQPDKELSTEYLLEHVWKNIPGAIGDTVWLYVSYLRGKLDSVSSKVYLAGERNGPYRIVIREDIPADSGSEEYDD